MRLYFVMFITADCFLFLLKLRWPRNKSIYDLEWDTLETKRKKNKLTLMFKLNHKLMDMKTEEYSVPNSETRTSKILSHWSMEYLKLAKTFLSLLLFSSNHVCLQWLFKKQCYKLEFTISEGREFHSLMVRGKKSKLKNVFANDT